MNKLTDILRGTILIFRPAVFVFAVLLIGLPWIPLHGQQQPAQITIDRFELNEVGHRLEAIEHLDLQHRLTVLETIQQDAKEDVIWHKGSSVGTGLLLIEAVARTVKKKKQETP